jgi:hypothetical protein
MRIVIYLAWEVMTNLINRLCVSAINGSYLLDGAP